MHYIIFLNRIFPKSIQKRLTVYIFYCINISARRGDDTEAGINFLWVIPVLSNNPLLQKCDDLMIMNQFKKG